MLKFRACFSSRSYLRHKLVHISNRPVSQDEKQTLTHKNEFLILRAGHTLIWFPFVWQIIFWKFLNSNKPKKYQIFHFCPQSSLNMTVIFSGYVLYVIRAIISIPLIQHHWIMNMTSKNRKNSHPLQYVAWGKYYK